MLAAAISEWLEQTNRGVRTVLRALLVFALMTVQFPRPCLRGSLDCGWNAPRPHSVTGMKLPLLAWSAVWLGGRKLDRANFFGKLRKLLRRYAAEASRYSRKIGKALQRLLFVLGHARLPGVDLSVRRCRGAACLPGRPRCHRWLKQHEADISRGDQVSSNRASRVGCTIRYPKGVCDVQDGCRVRRFRATSRRF